MAGHPLRPATHRSLGKPLPYQLANETRAHLGVVACKQRPPLPHEVKHEDYPVLAAVSRCYPGHQGRLPTRYSPVRRSTQDRSPFLARLACVKHASSVQSEPGSNSPVKNCEGSTCIARILLYKSIRPTRYLIVKDLSRSVERKGNLPLSPKLVNDFFRFSFERTSASLPARLGFTQRRGAFLSDPRPFVNYFLHLLLERSLAALLTIPVPCGEWAF